MNKKVILAGASIAVGTILLVTTAFASMAGGTGYDTYKEAVKNTFHAKSFSADVHMSMKDNGTVLAEATTSMKQNHDNRSMSSMTDIKAQGKEVSMDTYANEDSVVLKQSDKEEYYLMKNEDKKFREHDRKFYPEQEPEMSKAGEAVIDALVGDLKNYVSASNNSDGSANVTIKLEDNQIPAVVNAIAAFGVKGAGEEHKNINNVHEGLPFEKNFDIQPPKLVSDIKINKIDVKAKINKDNIIESQIINAEITGKDADGKVHEVEMSVDMSLKDVNNTTVDKVDLTGKQVKEIKREDMNREHSR